MIGVVAAGVIWRLGRRRREQMQRRPTGRIQAANPAPVIVAEAQARAIADGDAMRWVDAGMRYLGAQLGEADAGRSAGLTARDIGAHGSGQRRVSSVVLVRAGNRGLEVMVSPPSSTPPEGWMAVDEGTVWVLDGALDLEALEQRAAGRWSLLPALVTVGVTVDGTVLANLEHAGSLAVEGDPDTVRAVAAQMLMELTSQPWADEMLAGLHALGDPGAPHLPGVDPVADPMALAETLDGVAERNAANLDAYPSAAARRAVDAEPLPHVVVAFADADPEALRCLVEAAVPDRSGVAVVASGAAVDARWRLSIDSTGNAVLAGHAGEHPFQLPLEVHVRPDVIARLGQALTAAADPADTPNVAGGETATAVSGPSERGPVELRLLGTVRLVGAAGSVEPARRDAPLAVLAYLATHAGKIGSQDLTAALWPADSGKERFGMPAPKTVQNVISRARSLLGVNAAGEHRLRLAHRAYTLDDSVTTDWQRFQTLAAQAKTVPADQATLRYREALELVEGLPFAGSLDSPFFEWVSAEQLEYTMIATIADGAEELARLALDAGDYELAEWAVERGLRIDPAREQLYQCWMHAVGRSADASKVAEVWQRLCAALQTHIDPAQSPSPASHAVYRGYVTRQDVRASRH